MLEVGVKFALASGPEIAELGRKAEVAGYDWLWVSERVAVPVDQPHPYDPSIDPWIALAYLAGATERIRLGTVVSQVAVRHPVIMARELATLDVLSRGRMVVGAGAGWVQAEFDATNIEFGNRGARLNEFLRTLRRLWTTPEEGWKGKFYQVPPVKLTSPHTSGGPPIWLGASNEAGLRRAARHGDGLLVSSLPLEAVVSIRGKVMEMRGGLGKTGPFPIHAQVEPPATVDAALALAKSYRDAGIDGIILSERLAREPGFPPDEVSAALLEAAHA